MVKILIILIVIISFGAIISNYHLNKINEGIDRYEDRELNDQIASLKRMINIAAVVIIVIAILAIVISIL